MGRTKQVLIDETIYRIDCFAKVGIGYVFKMKIHYCNPGEKEWHVSNETGNVSLGFTGKFDLRTIKGIKEGAEVFLEINVVLGRDRKANEKFIYSAYATKHARYDAWGPCFNASLSFIETVEDMIYGSWYSNNEDKTLFCRYSYNKNATYEIASRKNETECWSATETGTFTFTKTLLTRTSTLKTEVNISIDKSSMIEGMIRTKDGKDGTPELEGKWEMGKQSDPNNSQSYTTTAVEFKDGTISGVDTVSNKGAVTTTPFTGKYTFKDDSHLIITHSTSESPYFSNGEKEIAMRGNILLLQSGYTYLSSLTYK